MARLLLAAVAVIFVLYLPGALENRYRFGRASAYLQFTAEFGFTGSPTPDVKELIVAQANRKGAAYAALYVLGIAPIFGLIALLILRIFSLQIRVSALRAALGCFITGLVFSVAAAIQLGPIPGLQVKDGVVGAIGLWIVLVLILSALFGFANFCRRPFISQHKGADDSPK